MPNYNPNAKSHNFTPYSNVDIYTTFAHITSDGDLKIETGQSTNTYKASEEKQTRPIYGLCCIGQHQKNKVLSPRAKGKALPPPSYNLSTDKVHSLTLPSGSEVSYSELDFVDKTIHTQGVELPKQRGWKGYSCYSTVDIKTRLNRLFERKAPKMKGGYALLSQEDMDEVNESGEVLTYETELKSSASSSMTSGSSLESFGDFVAAPIIHSPACTPQQSRIESAEMAHPENHMATAELSPYLAGGRQTPRAGLETRGYGREDTETPRMGFRDTPTVREYSYQSIDAEKENNGYESLNRSFVRPSVDLAASEEREAWGMEIK